MDRRSSLKLLATGAIAAPAVLSGCESDKKTEAAPAFHLDRNPDELTREKKLLAEGPFFTDAEMATITALADIIIPKDEVSGSASEAGVPAFIDFIVRDMPSHQIPMRGGLRWLEMQCLNRYGKSFPQCTAAQQLELVDAIAYPSKATPAMKPGVEFFSLMRNLTASGFYTAEIGVRDLNYMGNQANAWKGVPDEILQQYRLSYTDKENRDCI
jgi:gluconate 2-dehydrogenase gamma chain